MKNLTLTAIATLAIAGVTSTASAQTSAYGLNSALNSLSAFSLSTGVISSTILITGADSNIVAIDFRPFNGLLYGLSDNETLYTINLTTGAATNGVSLLTATAGTTPSNSTLSTTSIKSIDVNPTVTVNGVANSGALRIVDNTAQNLRYVFDTNVLNLDTILTGNGTQAVGAAYTNNDVDGATGTQLFIIEASTSSLYAQDPNPNAGALVLRGALGVTVGSGSTDVGFDILTSGGTNTAYASLNSSLYTVDLASGTASLVGAGNTLAGISDIAVIPEPSTYVMLLGGLVAVAFAGRRMARKNA